MIDLALFEAYVSELEALRTHGQDFAHAHPDIAGRLDIGPRRSKDPQAERVVESAAFLAARMRMMIEESARETPLAMLSMLAPSLIEPIPSMAIMEMQEGLESQVIPRGSRFDFEAGGQVLACFSTTMEARISRHSVEISRLEASGSFRDGIRVRVNGSPPRRLMLYVGSNEINAAALMNALDEDLVQIEAIPRGSSQSIKLSPQRSQFHGFGHDEAALPARPAMHQAHRQVTEFMAFPNKFRFISISEPALANGGDLLFRFRRPLAIDTPLPSDLFSVNRIPVANLWRSPAAPIEVTGRRLEYPVRADTLRYRTIECHSVEAVKMFSGAGSQQLALDPILGLGNINGTAVRWGVRRTASRVGGEVMLYFQGLDYRALGRQRLLVVPDIIASNRDVAERLPPGSPLVPLKAIGNWQGRLLGTPSAYIRAVTKSQAMETLIGHIRSSLEGFTRKEGGALLKSYLRHFPGAEHASWIEGIKGISLNATAKMQGDYIQPGISTVVHYDSSSYRTVSRMTVRQVLRELFDSQRGLNRVVDVRIRSS